MRGAGQASLMCNRQAPWATGKLDKAKKIAQTEISIAQKLYKEILDIETKKSQKSIDDFLDVITNNFVVKKDQALASLEGEIDSLSTQIISKILS